MLGCTLLLQQTRAKLVLKDNQDQILLSDKTKYNIHA